MWKKIQKVSQRRRLVAINPYSPLCSDVVQQWSTYAYGRSRESVSHRTWIACCRLAACFPNYLEAKQLTRSESLMCSGPTTLFVQHKRICIFIQLKDNGTQGTADLPRVQNDH